MVRSAPSLSSQLWSPQPGPARSKETRKLFVDDRPPRPILRFLWSYSTLSSNIQQSRSACHFTVKYWCGQAVAVTSPSPFDFQKVFIWMHSTTPQLDGAHHDKIHPGLAGLPSQPSLSHSDTSIGNRGWLIAPGPMVRPHPAGHTCPLWTFFMFFLIVGEGVLSKRAPVTQASSSSWCSDNKHESTDIRHSGPLLGHYYLCEGQHSWGFLNYTWPPIS